MAADSKARLSILISGRGSNMVALADAVEDGRIPNAQIEVVISDQTDASGLRTAKERGLETIVAELKRREVDLVCLAGYMRILSQDFLDRYRGRILNIHPSLLPSFPGLNAQRQALENGVKLAGCTVHFVDETR